LENVTLKSLAALAVPAAISVLLNNAFKVIDQYSVQWLGVESQAAVGSCTFILIGLFSVFAVVSVGTGPLVARATGAQDDALRRRIIGNALSGGILLGGGVLLLTGLAAPLICEGLGLSDGTKLQAVTYLQSLAVVGFPLALAPVVDAIFIAVGRAGFVMLLQLLATLLNIVLNPLFIYVLDLGISRAAIATGISRGLSVLIGLIVLGRLFMPQRKDFYWGSSLRRIIRIGLPISWSIAMFALVYWALLKTSISPLGPAVNAALGIGFSALEGFTWPIFWGISIGVASLVGRYIGANRIGQANQTIRLAFPIVTVGGLLAAAVFWFGAEFLCEIFTSDPLVLAEAILYAKILAFSQLFVAYECLAEGVLEGAGDTRPILFWSVPWNILRIPLAWLFAFPLGFGAAGIWWVINITTVIKAAGKWSAVLWGQWKTIEV